ncbi:hypothetical protein SHY80_09965, partial [Streptococcus suis]|uniref:hypothetical protein n=1 Tax=Streptococcus suis TaxID=1307 RepID=UPI0029C11AA2
ASLSQQIGHIHLSHQTASQTAPFEHTKAYLKDGELLLTYAVPFLSKSSLAGYVSMNNLLFHYTKKSRQGNLVWIEIT